MREETKTNNEQLDTSKDLESTSYGASKGKKISEGKTVYEFDWDFIKGMGDRMSKNKGKYPPYNWKKPIDVEELKQALFRHTIEVMKCNYKDDGQDFGHLFAVALNAMMIYFQASRNNTDSFEYSMSRWLERYSNLGGN